jgi:archaellum component FlaC
MNRLLKISNSVLTFLIFFSLLLASCRSGGKGEKKDADSLAVSGADAAIYEDIKQAEKIFYTLPSPLESAMLIKSAGALFEDDLLNPIENTRNYNTNRSMALNLGIYTCDLSFASLYDQTQLIINYMNAAKKMADGLGILDAISDEDIEKLEANIHDTDVIMDIVSQTYLNSNSYLEENSQPAIAAIVLAGGWLEGLYISTQLVDMKDFDGNKLVGRIIDQKLSVDILIRLLQSNAGHPAVDELTDEVKKVKTVFDKITLTTSPVRPEYDQTSNVTVLKSEVKSDLSPEVFQELSALVAEIRSTLIK